MANGTICGIVLTTDWFDRVFVLWFSIEEYLNFLHIYEKTHPNFYGSEKIIGMKNVIK